VKSQLTAATDQSSTEKLAQLGDTYQGNTTDLTKIKTKGKQIYSSVHSQAHMKKVDFIIFLFIPTK
jgi:hypothetical protein